MKTLKHWLSDTFTRFRLSWAIHRAFRHDLRRYIRFSTPPSGGSAEQQTARLVAVSHSLEKGLAMAAPRPGFGVDKAKRLLKLLHEYEASYPDRLDQFGYWLSAGILHHYVEFQKKCGIALPKELDAFTVSVSEIHGGTTVRKREELLEAGRGDFKKLSENRISIRDFSDEPVPMELIRNAVSLARRTPSSCNRQSGRVYVIADSERIKKVCGLLTGFHAFGNHVDKLILVSSDTRVFCEARERHQMWTEGGMFAMSLIYALTYYGIAACVLNWSVLPERDAEVRRILEIDEGHEDLLFIALGNFKEENRVALSERRPVEEIMFIR